jgi:isopenicillin N synthase-like dioxygenase
MDKTEATTTIIAESGQKAVDSPAKSSKYPILKLVILDYNNLKDPNTNYDAEIEEAFGLEGYGICVVKNVPGFVEAREKLLPLAHQLGSLGPEKLKKLEIPESYYSVGWSHGKEQFSGKYDFAKGSFYSNPIFDQPKSDPEAQAKGLVGYAYPNVWPKEEVPALEQAVKDMGAIIRETAGHLAKQLDKFVTKRCSTLEAGKFERIIKETSQYCGRLLHYFPSTEKPKEETVEGKESNDLEGNWCGWHNDHSALTGLCSAMYINKDGEVVDFKDDESGLFIRKRDAVMVKAPIPKDCLAFQIGETSQILSGGALVATPHAVVQGKKLQGTSISRNSFAFFTAPEWNEPMKVPEGKKREDAFVRETFMIPKLQDRWEDNQNFFEFGTKTFKHYN